MSDNPELPPQASHVSSPPDGVTDHQALARRHHLRVELFWTVVILIAFTGLEFWLEHTRFGHRLGLEAHHWFHSLVEHRSAGRESAVVIVDIGNLRPQSFEIWPTNSSGAPTRQQLEFTPRHELQRLLEVIAAARPAAIGFDLDLSPERNMRPGPVLALATSNLLASALRITRSGVPVVFGVARTMALGPAAWLGDERYSGLAGAIPRRRGEARQLPEGILFEGRFLPSLSKALADAGGASTGVKQRPPRGFGWAMNLVSIDVPDAEVPGFEWREFYVNYSPLNYLRTHLVSHDTILRASPRELPGGFQGKLVIVGDASTHQSGDTVMVPGQDEPLPGVYAHACAAHTLVQAPLWKLNAWAGTALAFVLCLLVAWAIFEICWATAAHYPVSTISLTVLLSVVACGVVMAIGWSLMLARVMWMEVFLTVFVIIAHCLFEVFVFSTSWVRFKGGPARLGEVLVVPPQSEESH